MKLSKRTKIGYGIMSIADQCLYFMFGTFFLFYVTTVVGLDPTIASLIAAFGAVWDSICSAIIGNISDNLRSAHGKRRIFIMFSAVPTALFTVMIFTKLNSSEPVQGIYYFVAVMLFWTGFSAFFIPLLAWGAELTEDYDERVKLRAFAYAGNTVGMAVGAVLPSLLVEEFEKLGHSNADAWQYTAVLVGVVVATALLAGSSIVGPKAGNSDLDFFKGKRGWRKHFCFKKLNHAKTEHAFFELVDVWKLRPFQFLVISAITYLIANTVFVADRVYYYTYNMGLSGVQITLLMAIEPFAGFVFLPIFSKLGKKIDKRAQFVLGMSLCGISMVAIHFIGINNFAEATFMLFAFGLGAICYWQLMPALFYDICELDELINYKQRQGTILSMQVVSESLSEALGLLLLGQILKFSGFEGNLNIQSDFTLDWIKNSFALIPGILILVSAFMVYKYPISGKIYEEILGILEERRNGKEDIDISAICKKCKLGG